MLRIKTIIQSQGLTYRELADALGVSPNYVSLVVNERKNVSLETLEKFARKLQVPVVALFQGYQEPEHLAAVAKVRCPYCGKMLRFMRE